MHAKAQFQLGVIPHGLEDLQRALCSRRRISEKCKSQSAGRGHTNQRLSRLSSPNRPFNYVVDCISQALLWIYFQDNVQKLYVLSLRGAQEVDFLCGNSHRAISVYRRQPKKP